MNRHLRPADPFEAGYAIQVGCEQPTCMANPPYCYGSGLNAFAVEDFALDFRGLRRFVTQELDLERVLMLQSDMFEDAYELPAAKGIAAPAAPEPPDRR